MVEPAKREATYQDVLDAPEHMVAELLDGELFLQPRPVNRHAHAIAGLSMQLGPPFHLGRGGPGGWCILGEPELHLERAVLVPDLAGWRIANHPSLELQAAHFTSPPNWVCEVLSLSTARLDRVRKLPKYAAAGVAHVWLVDPAAQTLEVYRRQDEGWLLLATHAGEAEVSVEPFEAAALELAPLWV